MINFLFCAQFFFSSIQGTVLAGWQAVLTTNVFEEHHKKKKTEWIVVDKYRDEENDDINSDAASE